MEAAQTSSLSISGEFTDPPNPRISISNNNSNGGALGGGTAPAPASQNRAESELMGPHAHLASSSTLAANTGISITVTTTNNNNMDADTVNTSNTSNTTTTNPVSIQMNPSHRAISNSIPRRPSTSSSGVSSSPPLTDSPLSTSPKWMRHFPSKSMRRQSSLSVDVSAKSKDGQFGGVVSERENRVGTPTTATILEDDDEDMNDDGPLQYGRLIVLGYRASITAENAADPSAVTTYREGGNHTFHLLRRRPPNGYTLTQHPESLSSLSFHLQVNPNDSPLLSLFGPLGKSSPPSPVLPTFQNPSFLPTPLQSRAPSRQASWDEFQSQSQTNGNGFGSSVSGPGGVRGYSMDISRPMNPSMSLPSSFGTPAMMRSASASGTSAGMNVNLNLTMKNSSSSLSRRASMHNEHRAVRGRQSEECVGGDLKAGGRDLDDGGFVGNGIGGTGGKGFSSRCIALKAPDNQSRYWVHWCEASDSFDLFQVGREPGPGIDMVVPGPAFTMTPSLVSSTSPSSLLTAALTGVALPPPSTPTPVSTAPVRFPFRLHCHRNSTKLFAGAFDASGRLVVGREQGKVMRTGGGGGSGSWSPSIGGGGSFGGVNGRLAASNSWDAVLSSPVWVWRPNPSTNDDNDSASGIDGRWAEVSVLKGRAVSYTGSRGGRWEDVDDGDAVIESVGEGGIELGKEAIIWAGGVCFLWKAGAGPSESDEESGEGDLNVRSYLEKASIDGDPVVGSGSKDELVLTTKGDWGVKDIAAELKSLEDKWPLFRSRRRTDDRDDFFDDGSDADDNHGSIIGTSRRVSMDSNAIATIAGGVATRRPWVFIACGHVFSFIQASSPSSTATPTSAHAITNAQCYICRTPSTFIPLICRIHPDLLTGPPTHAFDPCGHMIDAKGAEKWGRGVMVPVAVRPVGGIATGPSGGSGGGWRWSHVCPFCMSPCDGVRRLFWTTED
ncbi:E3 ubiquitin-protein ligase pellino 2 [Blyttiomyces sp. JEL0837]|nr:E3 ubiquitin-protein ligase pellino 2 [Blyttiomyces sp. JEL0837]